MSGFVHVRRRVTVAVIAHHSQSPASQTREEMHAFHIRPVVPVPPWTAEEQETVKTKGEGALPAFRRKGKGFKDIGYQWLVDPAGRRIPGRPEWSEGSHAPGWNARSIGICLIGNFQTSMPPEDQIAGAIRLIREILVMFPGIPLLSHKEAMALVGDAGHSDCPGPLDWVGDLRRRLGVVTNPDPEVGDDRLYTA